MTTTDQVRKDWDSQANAWFEQRESLFAASRPVHEWLVTNLDPKSEQRILEVAAGPGDTGFLVAAHLGNGRLLSTDISAEMVDAARKRGKELGITNADYRVLDAQAMDLEDRSFDGAVCRWGFMLMPNPPAALRECRRVLKPGGRLAFAVFTGAAENVFASLPARALIEAGHLPRPTGEWQPGILALGDYTRLEGLVDSIGFTTTYIEPVEMAWRFADAAGYWNFLIDLTALGPLIRTLPEPAREAFRAKIDEGLTPFTKADGITLPSRCWCVVAIR
jgi:ubiquinone/menaquinone biosynthesis C-methylase UbiE